MLYIRRTDLSLAAGYDDKAAMKYLKSFLSGLNLKYVG